jgi:hypothetical protein
MLLGARILFLTSIEGRDTINGYANYAVSCIGQILVSFVLSRLDHINRTIQDSPAHTREIESAQQLSRGSFHDHGMAKRAAARMELKIAQLQQGFLVFICHLLLLALDERLAVLPAIWKNFRINGNDWARGHLAATGISQEQHGLQNLIGIGVLEGVLQVGIRLSSVGTS